MKQVTITYQERKCKMHGQVVDVFFGIEKRGEIRQLSSGYRYRVTRCNFGPVYPSIERVKQFIALKNPHCNVQADLFGV